MDPDNDNRNFDHSVAIVQLLREVVSQAFEHHTMQISELLNLLQPDARVIERRLMVYFISTHGDKDVVKPLLHDKDLFNDFRLKNEVANLFRKHFGELDTNAKAAVLEWIEDGPSDVGHQGHEDHWKLCKYSWISHFLSDKQLVRYTQLRGQFEEDALDLADRNSHGSGVSWGHVSPLSYDQLAKLPIGQVIESVNSWQPPTGTRFRSPSVEGLADVFNTIVTKNAREWSDSAMSLTRMKNVYISRAMNGWLTYAREHADLNWSAMMDLVDYILSRSTGTPTDAANAGVNQCAIIDHDWKWTRSTIAELIGKACDHGVNIVLFPRFLAALEVIAQDDPSSAIESRKTFFHRDHGTDALNSVRGKVAAALCDLALWLAKDDPAWDAAGGEFTGDIERLRPILNVIEQQLHDTSTANAPTWASYALRANQLRWIAPVWFNQAVVLKLNLNGRKDDQLAPWAFWLTFLKFQNAHRIWLHELRSCYEATIPWLESQDKEKIESIGGLHNFFEHLTVLYWQGDLELEGGGLIARTFNGGTFGLRIHAMHFAGRAIKDGEEPPPHVLDRFMALWDWYWQIFGIIDVTESNHNRRRFSPFGDWVASGRFGSLWTLERFLACLRADADADHGEDEIEQISKWLPDHPEHVLEACRLMIINDQNGWRMHLWKDPVKMILDASVGRVDAAGKRRELVEAIILRGHASLFNLTEENDTPGCGPSPNE